MNELTKSINTMTNFNELYYSIGILQFISLLLTVGEVQNGDIFA